jgi:hypothetical protein
MFLLPSIDLILFSKIIHQDSSGLVEQITFIVSRIGSGEIESLHGGSEYEKESSQNNSIILDERR